MKQIWISKAGAPEVLEIREAPDPKPTADEILLEVRSAGVNFADIMTRMGMYRDAPPLPCVVGYEVAGVVLETGENVVSFKLGDRVMGMTRFGGYSSRVVIPRNQIFPLPDGWSFHEAAGFPVNYITAYQMLVVMGAVYEGCTVLVHGAGGGVGTAATQLARIYRAEIYGTGSAWKHDYMRLNGVDYPINYRDRDFVRQIHDLTDGQGVEIVLDSLGGKHWKRSYKVLRATGRLIMFGASNLTSGKRRSFFHMIKTVLNMPHFTFHPINLIDENKGVLGVNLGHMWHESDRITGWVEHMLKWVSEGKLRPQIDRVFSFREAPKAHHYIQDRKNRGKVCLAPEKTL